MVRFVHNQHKIRTIREPIDKRLAQDLVDAPHFRALGIELVNIVNENLDI